VNASKALTTLLLLAPFAGGCSQLPWAESAAVVESGVSVPVMRQDFEAIVAALGQLESDKASPIAVPRVPTGALTVKELAPEGGIVAKGDEVVVFDETKLEIELENNMASFKSTARRIDRTQIQAAIEAGSIEVMREVARLDAGHARDFEIEDETIYSKLDLLEQEIRLDEAEETILFADASLVLRGEYYDIDERILDVERRSTETKLGRVQSSLAKLVLKAPIGGMVVYKKNWRGGMASVGDSLWPGNVVMSIVDPTSVIMRVHVLESEAAGIAVGAPATIRVDARSEHVFNGEVLSVAKLSRPIERGSPVKYFETTISIVDADPKLLKPGLKGEVRITAQEVEGALVIPRSALRGSEGEYHVLVETASGPERRSVELDARDRVRVVVTSGLEEGERVLLGDVAEREADQPQLEPGV
jgi:multidrug efflux pump subunit AcrA (membrane-fusion protein)